MGLSFADFLLASPPPLPPVQLVEGVALVASACSEGQRQQYVQQMLDIVTQPMQQILTQSPLSPPVSPTAAAAAAAAAQDNRLTLVIPLLERVTVRGRLGRLQNGGM